MDCVISGEGIMEEEVVKLLRLGLVGVPWRKQMRKARQNKKQVDIVLEKMG